MVQCDQAALTGESLPAKKFAGDVAFSGSAIKQVSSPACAVQARSVSRFRWHVPITCRLAADLMAVVVSLQTW